MPFDVSRPAREAAFVAALLATVGISGARATPYLVVDADSGQVLIVNQNGLHDPRHVSSARDMAMIARALLRDFPDHADLYGIGALSLGNQIIINHNGLIGRYPGADGMKTGFTCPAGFNVVATATH